MPIRIYALAKELNLDSKKLVDLCAKAGITGKGSALASLTDAEVDKVKDFISSSNKPAASSAGAPVRPPKSEEPFSRDQYVAPGTTGGKPRVITTKPQKAKVEAKEAPAPTPPPAPPTEESQPAAPVVETPKPAAAETPPAKPTPAVAPIPETPEETTPAPLKAQRQSAMKREDSLQPLPKPERPRPIDVRKAKAPASRPQQKKKETVVRVAAIPVSKTAPKKPKSNEPAPQKPIMTLPRNEQPEGLPRQGVQTLRPAPDRHRTYHTGRSRGHPRNTSTS